MVQADKKSKGGFLRTLIFISILMTLIVIAAAASFLAFQDDTKSDFIVLKADTNPIRVKPEDTGGKEIDHQDSAVLQMLDEINTSDTEIDRLVLPDANPELPPVALPDDEMEVADGTAPIGLVSAPNSEPTGSDTQMAQESRSADLANVAEEQTNLLSDNDTSLSNDVSRQNAADKDQPLTNETLAALLDKGASENINAASEVKDADKTTSEVATPTSRPEAKPSGPKIIEEPDSFDEDNPPLMVQLAAFRDQANAEQAAALLSKKHQVRLSSLQLGIMPVDTGSSGIFWRVITEPLPAVDARYICDMLKSAGQDCILRPLLLNGL